MKKILFRELVVVLCGLGMVVALAFAFAPQFKVHSAMAGTVPQPVINQVQGYNPAYAPSDPKGYTNDIVQPNQYMVIYGNFATSGDTVYINGQALPNSFGTVTYEGLSNSTSSPDQINVLLNGLSGYTLLGVTVGDAGGMSPTSITVAVGYAPILVLGGGESFVVGQSWNLSLSGGPANSTVSVCAIVGSYNGCTLAQSLGYPATTDSSGAWSAAGTFSSSNVGSWNEWLQFSSTSVTSNHQYFTVGPGSPSGAIVTGIDYTDTQNNPITDIPNTIGSSTYLANFSGANLTGVSFDVCMTTPASPVTCIWQNNWQTGAQGTHSAQGLNPGSYAIWEVRVDGDTNSADVMTINPIAVLTVDASGTPSIQIVNSNPNPVFGYLGQLMLNTGASFNSTMKLTNFSTAPTGFAIRLGGPSTPLAAGLTMNGTTGAISGSITDVPGYFSSLICALPTNACAGLAIQLNPVGNNSTPSFSLPATSFTRTQLQPGYAAKLTGMGFTVVPGGASTSSYVNATTAPNGLNTVESWQGEAVNNSTGEVFDVGFTSANTYTVYPPPSSDYSTALAYLNDLPVGNYSLRLRDKYDLNILSKGQLFAVTGDANAPLAPSGTTMMPSLVSSTITTGDMQSTFIINTTNDIGESYPETYNGAHVTFNMASSYNDFCSNGLGCGSNGGILLFSSTGTLMTGYTAQWIEHLNGEVSWGPDFALSGSLPAGTYWMKLAGFYDAIPFTVINGPASPPGTGSGPGSTVYACNSFPSSTPSMPISVRYIRISTAGSASWVSWLETEVYDQNGSKIALSPSQVTTAPTPGYVSGYAVGPQGLVDGTTATGWNAGQYSAMVTIDLGSVMQVSRIRLAAINTPDPANAVQSISESTDGSTFTPLTSCDSLGKTDHMWMEYDPPSFWSVYPLSDTTPPGGGGNGGSNPSSTPPTVGVNDFINQEIAALEATVTQLEQQLASLNGGGSGYTPPPMNVSTTFPATIVVTESPLYVRSSPSVSAPLAGSQQLYTGDTFTAVDEVVGQIVGGNGLWWKSSAGNYVWSGGTVVLNQGASVPVLSVTPQSVTVPGNALPWQMSPMLTISNPGASGTVLQWKASTSQPSWCSAEPVSGSLQAGGTMSVMVIPASGSPAASGQGGQCIVTFSDNGSTPAAAGNPQVIGVSWDAAN